MRNDLPILGNSAPVLPNIGKPAAAPRAASETRHSSLVTRHSPPPAAAVAAAEDGSLAAGLSKEQKKVLCKLAREAWRALGRPLYDPADTRPFALSRSLACETWRQEEQRKAVGIAHLTHCDQRHYAALAAHFSALAGKDRAAERFRGRAGSEPLRHALRALNAALEEARGPLGNPVAYARALCRAKFGTDTVRGLTSHQVWQLVFTLRRAAARKRAAKQARRTVPDDGRLSGQVAAWQAAREALVPKGPTQMEMHLP
jgi:hypothetical protein